MSSFILVHARWHGAWCWERVAGRLRDSGHTVHTPDRPTFDQVVDLVLAQPEPPVLLGHSSGGMTLSGVGELVPDRVGVLAYLAAFLMPTGMTSGDFLQPETGSLLRTNLVLDEATQTVTVDHADEVLFNDCTPQDAAWAVSMLRPEPVQPPVPPDLPLTDANFGSVRRVYLECLHDNAMVVAQQRRMQELLPCDKVYSLPSSHSPYLSMPDKVVECLLDAASLAAASQVQ